MKTIYVTVEGGLVQDVTGVPAGIEVVVIDYDVECEGADRLDVSPLDGEPPISPSGREAGRARLNSQTCECTP